MNASQLVDLLQSFAIIGLSLSLFIQSLINRGNTEYHESNTARVDRQLDYIQRVHTEMLENQR